MLKYIHLLFGIITVLNWGCDTTADTTEANQTTLPNILWITCEDLMPMLHVYGDLYAYTPNLDKLAEQGILFTQAFATAPVCSPARSSLATGVYAPSLGSQHLRSEIEKPDFIRTLPEILRSNGYYCSNNYKEDYNFVDTAMWDASNQEAHWRNRADDNQPFFSVFNIGITHQSQIFGSDEEFDQKYGNQLTTELRHDPAEAMLPPYYFDTPQIRKMWARYYDLVTLMDRRVGEILSQLEEDGLVDNTIVFFYADHGTGMPRGKRSLYDSGLQVPFIIRVPEAYRELVNEDPGSTSQQLVSFIDFPPTVLHMLDIEIPDYMQGQPFMGIDAPQPRKYVYATSDRVDEAFEVSRSVRSQDFLYIRNYLPHLPLIQANFYTDQSEVMQALRQARSDSALTTEQEMMWAAQRPVEELYKIDSDPHQVYNLADQEAYATVLDSMREAQQAWMLRVYDTGMMPECEMHHLKGDSTIYEMARNEEVFPLRRIQFITEATRMSNLDQLEKSLFDDHPLIRFWAIMGLRYYAGEREVLPGLDRLEGLLQEGEVYNQLAALETLCAWDRCTDEHVALLPELMGSDNKMHRLMAARTFELLFPQASSVYDAVGGFVPKLEQLAEDRQNFYELYSYWALKEAFK